MSARRCPSIWLRCSPAPASCRGRKTAGRLRSSGTECARSPTGAPDGCAWRVATSRRPSTCPLPGAARAGAPARRARPCSTERCSLSTRRDDPASSVCSDGCTSPLRAPSVASCRRRPVTYAIFDLLYLDGRRTLQLPYREQRELLEGLNLEGPAWQTPAYHSGSGRDLLTVSAEHGLEGVLAKRLDAPYRPGERSGEWLKVKLVNRQEFVIGGWLDGKGRRAGSLGALLVGYYEGERDGRALRYAGRVGTGFDEHELERLAGELAHRRRAPARSPGAGPSHRAARTSSSPSW